MDPDIARRNQLIEDISDPNDKEIAMALNVVFSACDVGANAARLEEETGYPRPFIEKIAMNMQEAGLWVNGFVNDLEWRDAEGIPLPDGLFAHTLVALGKAKRNRTPNGCFYVDAVTGAPLAEAEWSVAEDFVIPVKGKGASCRFKMRRSGLASPGKRSRCSERGRPSVRE